MLDDVQATAGRLGRSAVPQSFLDRSRVDLRALCCAAGFEVAEVERATKFVADVLAPWGHLPIGSVPRCPSEISDDHYPIEFSLALGPEGVEVRVLFEAQVADGSLLGRYEAALELNRRLERQHGVDGTRLRAVETLFEPRHAQATYGIWHSICLRRHCAPKFKAYLNPLAAGRERAHELMVEALDRLNVGHAGRDALQLLRPQDEIKFFCLDLVATPAARIKIYKVHHHATRTDIEAELRRARCYQEGAVAGFFRAIAASDGPFDTLPISTYLALRAGDEQPSSCTVHFPIRAYADDDAVVHERVSRFLNDVPRETYERALEAFARRPLADGIGMHAYVALGLEQDASRLTIYLAPEAYQTNPPRASDASDRVARDAAGITSTNPDAVLRPASIDEVVQIAKFCGRRGIRIVAIGQGDPTCDQASLQGGVVIDLSSLDIIHSIDSDRAVVDAGVTWRRLLEQTTARGLTPPVLTSLQRASIGDTLSAGGISGLAYDKGAQVDHVLELEVVTRDGQVRTCSEQREKPLFDAVLAGYGRCALILRATLRLVPARTHVRESMLRYSTARPFLRDLRALARRRELHSVSGTICEDVHGGIRYELNALHFFTPPELPDTSELLRGLKPELDRTCDRDYLDHYLQVDRPRPWFEGFIPDASLEAFLREVTAELSGAEVGPAFLGSVGHMHLFPLWTEHLHRPLLHIPPGELVFSFDILPSAHTASLDAAYADQRLARNSRLFDRVRALGGTRHGLAVIPTSHSDVRPEQGDSR